MAGVGTWQQSGGLMAGAETQGSTMNLKHREQTNSDMGLSIQNPFQ